MSNSAYGLQVAARRLMRFEIAKQPRERKGARLSMGNAAAHADGVTE